ncbi:MAG: histone deacetylase family protein [Xanthomonadales bacterium]|nr:histone deacetylase family protein [Xanthomonadales bacterium]
MLVYTHPACLDHQPGPGHPEHPGRLGAVLEALKSAFADRLSFVEAPAATETQLLRVHSARLLAQLQQSSPDAGLFRIDADTTMSPASLDASLRCCGAVCAAVDAVMHGPGVRIFCALRPPGHHSTADQAMGFCLYNQIAVGAAHALEAHALERVTIVDFDVHHGNGTQAIFIDDPRVQYVSSHQSPLYPGTGREAETVPDHLVNGVLLPGSGSSEFRRLWTERLLPAIDRFSPQLLLVSAGFDAHRLDPLADLNLGADEYHWITLELMALADKHAGGRLVSALEGGYSLTALRQCSVAHVGAMLAERTGVEG